jgi:putative Mg2+ transporter-C (MgtC) family protein
MLSTDMLQPWDIILRLFVATLAGCLLGLNREMQGKPAGLRTHALVSLGAALMAVTILNIPGVNAGEALSRVMQGVLTGIGFLGAGVILQNQSGKVTGLTTAAMVWIAAMLGLAAGAGRWVEVAVAMVLIFIVLLLERWERHIQTAGEARKPQASGKSEGDGDSAS